MAPCEG